MRQLKLIIAALFLISPFAANADLIVDFTTDDSLGNFFHNGQFVGTDTNNDGILTFSELISFDILAGIYAGEATIANLDDIGDYVIGTNTWIPNGISWTGYSDTAWYTWDNRFYSARLDGGWIVTTSSISVPEPGTLALLGIGLFGMGLASRKKA